MRIEILAIGRLKDGPNRLLFQNYVERFEVLGRAHALGPLKLQELPESRARSANARKDDEAERLMKCADNSGYLVALDERGKTYSSKDFSDFILRSRDDGLSSMTFVIGGADGHGALLKRHAKISLSLGPMTLPHGLARIVLAEQLYRATTIIARHPYHRQ